MDEIGRLALIALGSNANSNWGNPAETVQKSIQALQKLALGPVLSSPLYGTPAFPPGAGPDFVNMACRFFTKLSAEPLLGALHEIEADAGRIRDQRWQPRCLDLDLIALGADVYPDAMTHAQWRDLPLSAQASIAPDQLILPHPRLQDRSFVLVPLADIAPDWHHPLLDLTVTQLRDACPEEDRSSVVLLT
ncbi:2-amino-4-hydroxy-6-hydroxymethyldihydropteridine diphosphokinase [Yoonia sp. BS5-3]|uniref:2-amino-4-hydroxy-6-hydroxymethyldihydropteridine pyrophosphokinase n=1 Tax=Yoonia phaeophyticola TaxID=3137369 RepID=A0ABZ2V7H3_9RHOB